MSDIPLTDELVTLEALVNRCTISTVLYALAEILENKSENTAAAKLKQLAEKLLLVF